MNAVMSQANGTTTTNNMEQKPEPNGMQTVTAAVARLSVLESLPPQREIENQVVLSGNSQIGGLFARHRLKKQRQIDLGLKVGCCRYNGLLEIWGVDYLRKSPEDLRRAKQMYREVPIGDVRWIEEAKRDKEGKESKEDKVKEESGEDKLKRVLSRQLDVILEQDGEASTFDAEQKGKILQSAHKKVLKAYAQLSKEKKQKLTDFVDNMTHKIDDLVRKYVVQYKKRGLGSAKK